MKVQQTTTHCQAPPLPRREKRKIELEKYRLQKKIRKFNLPVTFDNDTTTKFANFGPVESFKQAIGFKELIKSTFTMRKAPNSKYQSQEMLDFLVDAQILGLSRFEHINDLRYDPGYLKIKGDIECPEESAFRRLFKALGIESLEELRSINQQLIALHSQTKEPTEIWLDCDDTVITLHGNQEGGEVGYNPRYHGRPSIKAKACFIAETAELVNLKAYGGKTHSNGEFLNFFKEAEGQLPHNYVPKGVRMDKGFFDEKNFEYFESRTLLYVCKAPMRSGLKKIVNYLKEQNLWQELDECYCIAELTVPLPSWNKARRFIVICQKKDPKTGQLYIDHPECYQYQAIVTNIETNDMSPEEVWHFYNKRGTCELWINELKDGFAVDEASQHTFVKNEAYMLVKAISYNLMLWFKEATMPDEVKNCRAKTIRRKVLCVPGNIVGNGRYRHVRLAANKWLETVINQVKTNLDEFLYLVVQRLYPIRC
jgi:hypothetical protein